MQTILLSDEEAQSFLEFRKNQDTWDILSKSGIFNITNGSAEIHFNHQGNITLINSHLATFRRVKVLIPSSAIDSSPKTNIM